MVIVNPQITGGVRVIKTADSGEALPGVVFGIYKDGQQIETLTTGADGTATSGTLYYGAYELRELSTMPGYELLVESIPFSILTYGTVVTLPIQNQKEPPTPPEPGTIKIIKKAEDAGTLLPGAVFGVYDAATDTQVVEFTTDENGEAVTGELPVGTYYLLEKTAPEGFVLDEGRIDAAIKSGEVTEITVTNKPISPAPPTTGKIQLIKKAEGSGKLLSGAVFGVYEAGTDIKIAELTTDKNGEAISSELPAGALYLREIKAPSGFIFSTEKTGVTVKAGETVTVTITNAPVKPTNPGPEPAPGTVKIVKKAEDTSKRLSGAVFTIYRMSDDRKVAEITTGRDGTATYTLDTDRYYLAEKIAPEGYKLSTDKISFTIKPGRQRKSPLPTSPKTRTSPTPAAFTL